MPAGRGKKNPQSPKESGPKGTNGGRDARKGAGRKKEGCLAKLLIACVSLACALALGALFYGAMVYQSAGEDEEEAREGLTLYLTQGEMTAERTGSERRGGVECAVLAREYGLPDGAVARAITATPAAYVERLSEEGWSPQLITGFLLAGLDAVYETKDGEAILLAREGETVFAIEGALSEEELYDLGAAAELR